MSRSSGASRAAPAIASPARAAITSSRSPTRPDGDARRPAGTTVHVAIDDATRLAYAEVLSDEKASTAVAFLGRALAFYARHGITAERVIIDNGSAYRATIHALAYRALGIRPICAPAPTDPDQRQ